ncbi:hypothetical protein DRQ53_06270 [bacterium]|nr:MAG: hypothetical protein DRQ32_00660 [bacterium]RKZ16475.1 MAG: hypothetical protein DRQ53_06270 [bacterium]
MSRMRIGILIILALFGLCGMLSGRASAQILNTLSGFQDVPGWQGEASGFFRLSGGNTDVQDYLASGAGQWQGEHQRMRAIANYNLTRTSGIDTSEDLTLHLRHNYRLRSWLASLAFTQYQRNPFQDLRARILIGGGLRFDLVSNEKRRLAIGLSAMYEAEELTDAEQSSTARFSGFVDLRRDLQQYMRVSVVGWYQPDVGNFADTRASVLADLDVDLVGSLAMVVGSSFAYDSRPPAGIEDIDWSVRTGLRLTL